MPSQVKSKPLLHSFTFIIVFLLTGILIHSKQAVALATIPKLSSTSGDSSSSVTTTPSFLQKRIVGNEEEKKRFYHRNLVQDKKGEGEEPNNTNTNNTNENSTRSKPYRIVILSTLLVNVATIAGVLAFAPLMVQKKGHCFSSTFWAMKPPPKQSNDPEDITIASTTTKQNEEKTRLASKAALTKRIVHIFVPSFASGSLLSVSIFLVIPESLAFIQNIVAHQLNFEQEGHHLDKEINDGINILPGTIIRFGVSLLAGYMLPSLIGMIYPMHVHNHGANIEESPKKTEAQTTKSGVNMKLVGSILVGDVLHLLCDGIFIGVAFMTCSKNVAWSIVGVTMYHEVATEIACFLILTHHAGLSILASLVLFFATNFATLLGGLLILVMNVSDMVIGVVLSFSAGMYLYIAAVECLPRVEAASKTRYDTLCSMGFFLLGATPIGLSLFKHEHCK